MLTLRKKNCQKFKEMGATYSEKHPFNYTYIPGFTFLTILKVHKIEIFFGFDFEICIISLLVM